MKSEKEVRRALKECYSWKKYHDQMDEKELGNNEGWIEALQFVLTSSEQPKQEIKQTVFIREDGTKWVYTPTKDKQQPKQVSQDHCVVCGKLLESVDEEDRKMCDLCEAKTTKIAKEIDKQVSDDEIDKQFPVIGTRGIARANRYRKRAGAKWMRDKLKTK